MKIKIICLLLTGFLLMSAEDGCEEMLLIKKTYPNPVQSELHVELAPTLFEEVFEIDYQVVNMSGQTVSVGQFTDENGTINCSELTPGYYIIQLPTYGESSKFIKK